MFLHDVELVLTFISTVGRAGIPLVFWRMRRDVTLRGRIALVCTSLEYFRDVIGIALAPIQE